jgi:hypothetical protein
MAGGGTHTSTTGRQPARLMEIAPGLTAAFVREALHRAIHGIGPLPPAASAPRSSCRSSTATSAGRSTR